MSIKHQYSEDQLQAIQTFGRNVSVLAGAGSGKTMLLVERFIYALKKKKYNPEQILAITFTEKAASEMKSRLIEECQKRGLSEYRRALEHAAIGTIHGFCAQLLKENPIESGVDPYFRILGEGESEILTHQIMDRLFEEEAQNSKWINLLKDFGESQVRWGLAYFYDMSRALGDPEDFLLKGQTGNKQKAHQASSQLENTVKSFIGELESHKLTNSEKMFKRTALEILSFVEDKTEPDWPRLNTYLKLKDGLHKRSPRFKEAIIEIHERMDTWARFGVEILSMPSKEEFLRVFRKFKENHEAQKKKNGSYDFEDLLLYTYKLLSSERPEKKEVRERIQNRFAEILVDEVQDTSPLQAKIIECLKKRHNLFIVGDIQQSIYSFRHADPQVFHELLERAGHTHSKKIILTDNYRSRPQLLTFINKLFLKIFDEVDFKPLEAKRSFISKEMGAIEFLCVPRDKKSETKTLGQARILEARALARHLRELVASRRPIEEKNGRCRPIEFSDIAVLFRTTTSSYLYEKELTDYGIPMFVWKGRGFFARQEVMDLVNLLKLLENMDLDIPLAGVLRSPLVNLSDGGLFWLAQAAKTKDSHLPLSSALDNLESIKEFSPSDKKKIIDFNKWFKLLRKDKDRLRLSEVLEEILRQTHYEAKLLTQPGGLQNLSNVRKLIEMAQDLERRGTFGIKDFSDYLEALSEREITEAQATVDEERGNAVTLATVHAAKGLEFPCVVIADMGARGKTDSHGHFLVSGERFGLKIKNPNTREWMEDFSFYELERELSKKELAEENRLLYVAMTRAKELLILSGSVSYEPELKRLKDDGSWMSRVAILLSYNGSSEPGPFDFEGIPIQRLEIMAPSKEMPRPNFSFAEIPSVREHLRTFKPISRDEALGLHLGWKENGFTKYKNRLGMTNKKYDQLLDATVTDLMLASLPEKGVQREHLEEVAESEEEPATPRNIYGTIFHRAMELLALKKPRSLSQASFLTNTIHALNSSEKNEIKKEISNFWNGPWGILLRKSKKCYPELPFIYKTEHGILKGQIDLVVETLDNQWMILDYKTNRLLPTEKETLAKAYEIQLSIYAFIFTKIYGKVPKKGVLYFSAIDATSEFHYTDKTFDQFEEILSALFLKTAAA